MKASLWDGESWINDMTLGEADKHMDAREGCSGLRQGFRFDSLYRFYNLEFYDFALPHLIFMGQCLDSILFVLPLLSLI